MTTTYIPNPLAIERIVEACMRDLSHIDSSIDPLIFTSPEEYNPRGGNFGFFINPQGAKSFVQYEEDGLDLPREENARYDALCVVMRSLGEGLQQKGYVPTLELKPLEENYLQRLANLGGFSIKG
ncbi:MAG: hypothetical protein WCV90_05395 [Candidatus Woesearchaeota archaeon]|jgi:hypothetical protein